MQNDDQPALVYSPSAVLNLFNNAINVPQSKRLIQLKGIFGKGNGTAYNNSYFDILRDESSDAQVTLIVPALIRNQLQPGKTIIVMGFISKRVVPNASRIDVQVTITDLVEQTQNKYSDDEIRLVELIQAKAQKGFRDVHSFIKEHIIEEQPFKIGIIVGKTAIIDSDIKHQLRESIGYYNLAFIRINLSSEMEIMNAMDLDYDIIAISRGGGENLAIFNRLPIVEKAVTMNPLLITAIGHKEDITALQKVADKAFITPSEFGQFLNDTYNQTRAELENSRAALVESVKKQLAAAYQKENETLQAQLTQANRLHEEKSVLLTRQVDDYRSQVSALQKKTSFIWVAVLIGLILGIVIARIFFK